MICQSPEIWILTAVVESILKGQVILALIGKMGFGSAHKPMGTQLIAFPQDKIFPAAATAVSAEPLELHYLQKHTAIFTTLMSGAVAVEQIVKDLIRLAETAVD
jgi:hypothetical protein